MRTPDQFIKEMNNINPDIQVIGAYTRAVDRIKVKCRCCGHIWEPKAYSLLSGKGCPFCSAKRGAINNHGKTGLKTTQQFIQNLKEVDDSIQVIGEYINGHSNIKLQCQRCGHVWEAKPYSVLQGHGCPRCAKSGTSFMEQFILLSFKEKLENLEIISRDRKTIKMEIDIYIPQLKYAIEPGNWLLHKKNVNRDKMKRDLCAAKGIKLVTIYDKFPNDEVKPFDDNLYTFPDDLNKADHSIIRNLVLDLMKEVGLNVHFSETEWSKIENSAYENSKSMTHKEFIKRMQLVHPTIKVLGHYQNTNKRLKVKCTECGNEWNAVPANLLSGDDCRKCGTIRAHIQKLKSQSQFVEDVLKANPNNEVIGEYKGRHSPVKVRCKLCGYTWEPKASSLLRGSSHKYASTMHKQLNLKKSLDNNKQK